MSEQDEHVVHHAGYSKGLELALATCLCYTLCVLGLRLYIRWRAFGIDDFVVLCSSVLAFVFFGCSFASKATGLGLSSDVLNPQEDVYGKLNTSILVGNLSWIAALCLSKLAIVSMLLRTTQTASHQRLQYFAGALIFIQCITSIILITANCTGFSGLAWESQSNAVSCPGQKLRWHVITGLDIATEVALLVLPLHLVWNLQMPTKTKLIVIVAFWLRIPTLIFTIVRNGATTALSSSSDVSKAAAMVVVWQAIEMSYSIAAATIAALKRFTESLNTGFGHGELMRVHGHSQAYKTSDRSASLKRSSISKPSITVEPIPGQTHERDVRDATPEGSGLQQLKLRPKDGQNETVVSSLPKSSGAGDKLVGQLGSGNNENIILQDLRYSVHYDEDSQTTTPRHQQ